MRLIGLGLTGGGSTGCWPEKVKNPQGLKQLRLSSE